MKKLLLASLLSLSFVFLLAAPTVFGAGLVQCDEQNPTSCSLCALFETVKAIYSFVSQAAIILAVAFIMFGGYQMMISGANPGMYAKGKSHIFQALQGLALVLAAWFLVDILIRALTGTGNIYSMPWETLQCQGPEEIFVDP